MYAYHNDENHDRCIVCLYQGILNITLPQGSVIFRSPCLYDLYVSKRPVGAREDALFLAFNTGGKGQWYKNMALGHNSLANVVKTITAGLPARYTNQSLRRTGCQTPFSSRL